MSDDVRLAEVPPSSRRVVSVYLTTNAIFTLATSIIWGVNTLFLLGAGLSIFQVMLVNTAFTVGQIIFEVPTGVVADTIGRKASFLLASATLLVSTLWYVGAARFHWGMWSFAGASVLLGLGFTFQTGAVDAWLVDALDHTGWEGSKDRVFGWGGATFGAAMLVGTLAGGFLGQIDLQIPYVVRAVLLGVCFFATMALMREWGFEPRPLKLSRFGEETRAILETGTRYGWRSPVVRPLMFVSLATGLFFIFGFYALQPYLLQLLGRNLVWVVGVVTAASSVASIGGNSLVRRVMETPRGRRSAPRILALASGIQAVLLVAIGCVGLFMHKPGLLPFGIVVALWMAFSALLGVGGPVRQGFINDHIPSKQRATVLSLDSFFADVGGSAGQPALGYLAQVASIPAAIATGALVLFVPIPLYLAAQRAVGRRIGSGGAAATDAAPAPGGDGGVPEREQV
jgi:MFS family permease